MNSPSSITANAAELAVVSLGSNLALDDRSPSQLVLEAMDSLRQISLASVASSLYRSEPQDCPVGSDDFINAVMVLQLPPATTAPALLAVAQRIEARLGRRRGAERNAPRTLDLDIISFKDQQLETKDLTIPHPRAALREFVLLPLCEIAPGLILAGQDASIEQLLQRLPRREGVYRLDQDMQATDK